MGKLLKFEFAKLIKSKAFYICIGVCIALIVLMGSMADSILPGGNSAMFFRLFTEVSMITTVICIPVSIFVCEDAQCGAEKTVLGRGISRRKFFFAKYISSLVGYMVFVLVTMLTTYLVGIMLFDYAADSEIVPYIFLTILGLFMYHGIYFGVATITGKNGFSIAIAIVAPLVIEVLVLLLDYATDIQDFTFQTFSFSYILNQLSGFTEWNKEIIWAFVLALAYPCLMVGVAHEIYVRKEN